MDGTADFESVGRSFDSSAGCLTIVSPECAGFAHEPAKLEDQVRFLAATLDDAGARWPGGCLQSSSQWVRFPPASLTDQLPVRTTSSCEEAQRLNYPFVGRSQYEPNCLLGVHDGPKVAMPGDRLVHGAGVSRRRRGQSTVGDSPIRTAVANAALDGAELQHSPRRSLS
jgi:hypothetical protein